MRKWLRLKYQLRTSYIQRWRSQNSVQHNTRDVLSSNPALNATQEDNHMSQDTNQSARNASSVSYGAIESNESSVSETNDEDEE